MIEKRHSSRRPIQIQLSISDLYDQEHSGIHNLESPIEVVNISSGGIGLISECILPLNHYFNASLVLAPGLLPISAVVKIIRVDVLEKDLYRYGCEFTELAEEDRKKIERLPSP